MRVMFIPDYRRWNPYQTNLSHSLSDLGVFVDFDNNFLILKNRRYLESDILHIHWPNPFMVGNSKVVTIIKSVCFVCELLLLKMSGVKIVWTVHNILGHDGKFKSIELLFNKFLVMLCNKLIVHCPLARTELGSMYNEKLSSIVVIPHGNYKGYKNKMTGLDARDKLKLNTEDIIFLCIGQIRPYKGISELIRTFKNLNCPRAKMLIVGKPVDSKITEEILNSCKDNYNIKTVLEFIPDEDIQVYMNAADIVILPYSDILTSGAALLSMSFGKPIMAPAIGCITDTFDSNGGFLYNKEDDLSDVMMRVINTDKKTLENMGKYNLKLAEQFGWKEIGKKTYNVYKDCIR